MNFKFHRHNGFALMEVIISLAMIGVLLTTLMMVESRVFHHVIMSRSKVDRFYLIQNMFFLTAINPLEDNKKEWEKTHEDPAVQLKYEKKEIRNDSELYRFKGLFQERASGKWYEWGKEREYDIINYQFVPVQKEKKDVSP